MAVGSQLAAALLLMPLVPFRLPETWPSPIVIAAVLLLALASTAFAYVLYYRLIVDIGPTRALTVTFLVPLFAVVWGRLFLGEAITASTLVGCGIILVGTALVTGVRLARPGLQPSWKLGASRKVPDDRASQS
jgi:drug/metabolite transporter (DMT)-like permease